MAITAYCKKCRQDVPPGDVCPQCGGKLAKSALRVAWCVEHHPVKDWLCWNAVARIVLPAYAAVLALVLLLEGLTSGVTGIETLLRGGLLVSMVMLLVLTAHILLIVLCLQGDDLIDCVVDSKGVHVQQYLVDPTPLKLLLRFRSPGLMQAVDDTAIPPVLLIGSHELAWKDMARVQLWQEKTMVLLYAPHWWMRLALPCTPFTYQDTLEYMRDKVGRRKNLLLPKELIAPPAPKKPRAPKAPAPVRLSFEDLPAAEAQPEPLDVAEVPEEQPRDFVPLNDVLSELKSDAAASSRDETQADPPSLPN